MPVMDGIDAVGILTDEEIAPAILLTAYSDQELVARAKAAGVFAYLVKPYKPSDLAPTIEVARSRFEQNKDLNSEVSNLQEKLETRKLIDRAKGILMDEQRLNETEAYRKIQIQSMNLRKTMKEVAEAIILAKSI
jgi:response regulator NasT